MRRAIEHDYDKWLKEKQENAAPKKTSDDCYTPPELYDYLIDWIFTHTRKADGLQICRPFYPGGDYEHEDYTGKVVIDNPPFSILTKIVQFYEENNILYFVFAPGLSTMAVYRGRATNYIFPSRYDVIYENGVCVKTAFISNLFDHKIMLMEDLKLPKRGSKRKRNVVNFPAGIYNSARLCSKAYNAEKNTYIDDFEYTTTLPDGKRIFGGGIVTNEYTRKHYSKTDT